jgi:FtsZ-interacting cell division protein ZipA
MKAFLEEYGLVVVVIIVLVALLIVATYVSKNGESQLKGTYDAFSSKANSAMEGAGMSVNTESPTEAPTE